MNVYIDFSRFNPFRRQIVDEVYQVALGALGITTLSNFLGKLSKRAVAGLCLSPLSPKIPSPSLISPLLKRRAGTVLLCTGTAYVVYLTVFFEGKPLTDFGPLGAISLLSFLTSRRFRQGYADGVRVATIVVIAESVLPHNVTQFPPLYLHALQSVPPIQLAFAGPVVEELAYRGCELPLIFLTIKEIFTRAVQRPASERETIWLGRLAIALSSCRFALDHQTPWQMVYAFGLGVLLAEQEHPLAAEGAHMAFNTLAALKLRLSA